MQTMPAPDAPILTRPGLHRSRSRLLGGVAGGLAEYWGVDPVLLRVIAVSPLLAAVAMTGFGMIFGFFATLGQLLLLLMEGLTVGYLVAWAVVPDADGRSVARWVRDTSGNEGVVIKVVAATLSLSFAGALLVLMAPAVLSGGEALPFTTIALGLLLAMTTLIAVGAEFATRRRPPAPAPAPQEAPPASAVAQARAAAQLAAQEQRAARAEERAARRAVRRERNRWGLLVAAAALIIAGVLSLTDRAGATSLGWSGIAVVGLAILTIGVLVGTWFGSGRWLIAPALVLVAALGASQAVDYAKQQAIAAPPVAVSPTSLPPEGFQQNWSEGAVTVDLTAVRNPEGGNVSISVGRGSLTLILRADQWAEVLGNVLLAVDTLPPGTPPLPNGFHSFGPPASDASTQMYVALDVQVGEITVITKEA